MADPHDMPPGFDDPEFGWLPTTTQDQHCAFCQATPVSWLHPLAAARVQFRIYGKGHTLPNFWTLCADCESTYLAGDDETLVRRMIASDGWPLDRPEDLDECVRQPLRVFRSADLGAMPLPWSPGYRD